MKRIMSKFKFPFGYAREVRTEGHVWSEVASSLRSIHSPPGSIKYRITHYLIQILRVEFGKESNIYELLLYH